MLTIPARCTLCHVPLRLAHHGCCSICLATLRLPFPLCYGCGLPASHRGSLCGRCLNTPPLWSRLIAVSGWHAPVSEWVKQLKFSSAQTLAPLLARLLLLRWLEERRYYQLSRPELILSVPLHKSRAWQRGYNQSQRIASLLAHACRCQYLPAAIIRIRRTRIQHTLSAQERRHNLDNAFAINGDLTGRDVVVIDDIVTTGSTLQAVSRLLLAEGVSSVQVWCLCRTLSRREDGRIIDC
ncbi:MAG: hypothetical protein XXXJIFNMEKO3_03013 [Candidatus Erwinia impunctatus]|nr:hypothetical protein XXXJIFNMEKO_03013 [Culicoides impunctatus]